VEVRAEDEAAMRTALDLARQAGAAGEVPIAPRDLEGAGADVAPGSNLREATNDPTAHAEVVALRRASAARGSWRLTGTTLVVTLEPCPMCAGAAWLSRVDRLVFGAWNKEYGAAGSLWDVLRDRRLNHHPEIVAGVLADECGAVIRDFFAARR
jgi:tRNA(adenine34) deaminase